MLIREKRGKPNCILREVGGHDSTMIFSKAQPIVQLTV